MNAKIVLRAVALAISCVITFWLTTNLLASLYSVSREDDLLGGMWAVIATIFVYRENLAESMGAALSRMVATLVSFALCFVYLIFFPFSVWGMAALIGISAVAVTMMGRPNDTMTAAITTTVVLVAAAIGPHDAWRLPLLRLLDTAVGVAVGLAVARISGLSVHHKSTSSFGPGATKKAGA